MAISGLKLTRNQLAAFLNDHESIKQFEKLFASAGTTTGVVAVVNGGTGSSTSPMIGVVTAATPAAARSILGLGGMATQDPSAVSITGGSVNGSAITGNISGSASNVSGVVAVSNGGTGASTDTGARTNLGLGSMATQGASAVAITGGSVSVSSYNGGQLAGMRNKIINGSFIVNQRGYASGAATSGANEYTLDRWRVVTSGQNITYSASGNGNEITAPAGGVEQVIEGINIEGGTYVISWVGTATAAVNGVSRANGASFMLTANTDATIRLTGGTASLVQLEPGQLATPFEHRFYSFERTLCRRYARVQAYYVPATTAQNLGSIEMRATPTITGGGAGFTSTGTTSDQLIAFQTAGAVATLTLKAEL